MLKAASDIIVLEIGPSAPSALFEAIFAAADGSHVVRVSALADVLPSVHEAAAASVVLLHWNVCSYPHYIVELLLKDPRAASIPLMVACDQPKPEDIELWKEYGLSYGFAPGQDPAVGAARFLALVGEDRDATSVRAQRARRQRRFFHLLHQGDLAAAGRQLDEPDMAQLGPAEMAYLRSHILKRQRELGEAFRLISGQIGKGEQSARTAAKFQHLAGQICLKRQDYRQARSYLEAAQKLSPKHLSRQRMLAQLYCETNEPVPAIQIYKQIFTAVPEYPGIHVCLVELVYARATQTAQIDAISRMFPYIPDGQIIVLHKRVGLVSDAAMQQHFQALIARDLLRRCDQLCARDDYFGAINFLVRARRLIGSGDLLMQAEVHLKAAECHLATHNATQAAEHLDFLRTLGVSQVDEVRVAKARARLLTLLASQSAGRGAHQPAVKPGKASA